MVPYSFISYLPAQQTPMNVNGEVWSELVAVTVPLSGAHPEARVVAGATENLS